MHKIYVGVMRFIFSCSPTLYRLDDLHNETYVVLADLCEASTLKTGLKIGRPFIFSYGYQKCTFVGSLTEYIGPPNCVDY